MGNVQLVSVPLAGVPNIGVTRLGLMLRTVLPVPVDVVTPLPPLRTGSAVPLYVIARVPAPVIGDPEIEKILGTVAATLVTVPPPVGADHVPSPRQNVLAEALVPEFKFETGKLADSEAALPLTFTWSPEFVPDDTPEKVPDWVARVPSPSAVRLPAASVKTGATVKV